MTIQTVQQYQNNLKKALVPIFGFDNSIKEWPAFDKKYGIYSPRIDVSVGPYSFEQGKSLETEYNIILKNHKNLVKLLIESYRFLFKQIFKKIISHMNMNFHQ